MTSRSYLVLLLAVLIAGVPAFSSASADDDKQEHFQKALSYKESDNPKAAIIELLNAIRIDSTYAEARYQLGLLYLDQGEHQKAFGELVRAADLDHNNLDANLKAAEFYLIARKKAECRQLIERILAIDPGYQDALALLANLELLEGQYDKAMAAIDSVGERAASSDKVLNIRGRIFAAREQWAEAEHSFQQAIEADGTNFNNYRALLSFYQAREEKDKMQPLLDLISERFPDDSRTHQLRAAFYLQQGSLTETEAALLKVVETAPDQAANRLQLASFYQQHRMMGKAETVLLQAMEDLERNEDISAALAGLYFDQQKFDQATALLAEIKEKSPDHGGAALLEARFLIKDGKAQESLTLLNQLNKNYPKWAEPYFYLGIAHLSVGEADLAQHAIATAIELDKQNGTYRTLLAQLLLLQGSFEQAEKEAAIALRLSPNNLRAAILMGKAAIGAKQFQRAEELFARLSRAIPDNSELLGNLALAAIGAGNKETAETALEELLTKDPANIQATALLISLKHGTDPAAAEQLLRSRIEQMPENSELHLLLGQVLERQSKLEDALGAYEKAQQATAVATQAAIAAGRLLARLDRKDEAMTKFEKLLEEKPDSLAGHMGLASLLEQEGSSEEAMQRYRRVLELRPGFVPAANNLAWLLATVPDGDLGEALRLAIMAKQAAPDEPHIADTLGWVHYRRGSPTLAIAQYEVALQGRPDDPTISYHLALALQQNGETERARDVLQKMLSTNEDFSERENAEALLRELGPEKS